MIDEEYIRKLALSNPQAAKAVAKFFDKLAKDMQRLVSTASKHEGNLITIVGENFYGDLAFEGGQWVMLPSFCIAAPTCIPPMSGWAPKDE